MSEFVFILGAGASAHAKVPVMAKFLDRARELYSPNMGPPWMEHFERVLNILCALQSVHSKAELDLNNLEAVFFAQVFRTHLNTDVAPTPVIVPPGLFKAEYQGLISRVWQEARKN
jgi:hypothetical protein